MRRLSRGWRRWTAGLVVAVTPGVLALEPVAAEIAVPLEDRVEEQPAGRLLPHVVPEVEPSVPEAAPDGDGALAVPEDWNEPLPESARRSPDEMPEREDEVVSGRDAFTEVWENTDGTETVDLHTEAVHYRPDDGRSWEPIDNSLVPVAERPGWVQNAANSWTVRFGPIEPGGLGGVELVTAAGPARFAPVLPARGRRVEPVVGEGDDADTVTYPDVWPGVDVAYTVTGGRVKEDLVVRSGRRAEFPFVIEGLELRDAPEASGLALDASGAQGEQVSLLAPEVIDAQGRLTDMKARPSVRVKAGADAQAIIIGAAAVEPDVGEDSVGEPEGGAQPEMRLSEGAQVMTVAVDAEWLGGLSEDELPVVVDPTVVLDQSFRAAYRSDGTTLSQEFRVGNSLDGGNSYWRSAAVFNYAPHLEGKQVLAAGLGLGVSVQNPQQSASGTFGVSAWWACSGSYSGAICGGDTSRRYATGSIGGEGTGTTLDVRDLIATWQFFGVNDGLFGLRGAETAGTYTYKRLHPPTLTLNLNTPVADAPELVAPADDSLAIVSTTPTLKWNGVTDPDGDPVKYVAKIATGADGESGLVASSPLQASTSWQVPAGVLRDGVTYFWKVFATDGKSWSWKPSAVRSLTVDRRLGAGATSPTDEFDGVTTNLVTGNAAYSLALPDMVTVGGGIGVDLVYNSQAFTAGLAAEYRYDVDSDAATAGIESSDPVVLARTDSYVSFDWRTEAQGGAPGSSSVPSPGVPEDHFTVRWKGYVALPAGDWQFGERVDDGIRIRVGGAQVLDDWSNGDVQEDPEFQSGTVAGGQVHEIEVDYREATGPATVELWARDVADPENAFVVPAAWLSLDSRVLPGGWSLQAADLAAGYTRAEVSDATVTLFRPDGSALAFQQTALGLGYTPPEGVEDIVTVNTTDGTVTVVAEDGYTYTFRPDGQLDTVTSAIDDQNRAAATQTYDSSGRLTALGDPVSGREVTLTYGGSSSCPTPPSFPFEGTGVGPAPAGMLCEVAYWDGTATKLFYKNGLLAWVRDPGNAYTGFGYDTSGRLATINDPLVWDAVWTGTRIDYEDLLTEIAYDGEGRLESVTAAAPRDGGARPERTFAYAPTENGNGELTGGTATVTRTGTSGTHRAVTYDAQGRVTADTNAAGETVSTAWNAEGLIAALEGPDGLRTTTMYDSMKRPTDTWGPAPASMLNPDGTGQAGVPHELTRYDEGIDGLEVRWWNNPDLKGSPVLHQHDPGALNANWGTGSPAVGVVNDDNFSGRYTGEIVFPAAGDYTFRFVRDNRLAFYLDGQIVLHKWDNTTSSADDVAVSGVTAGESRRLRVDFAELTGSAQLQMQWKAPGSSGFVDVPGASLRPGFGLVTSTVDASGNTTAREYVDTAAGLGPQHGVAVRTIVDPGGLSLTETSGYEPVGSGYLRRVSRTLPAGAGSTTTSEYYADTETRSNPCTTGDDPAPQGGLQKLDIASDPDGSGPQAAIVRESIYDAAGRTVAQRIGSEPWICTTYDARGRVTEIEYPAFGGEPARTVATSYVADPDGSGPQQPSPFVTATSDPAGTITAEVDLSGQPVTYTDVWGNPTMFSFDQAGRETQSVGPVGTITKTYDAADRVTSVSRNGDTLAENLIYDTGGRLTQVVFPSGQGKAGNGTFGMFGYDSFGRVASSTWVGAGWSLLGSDEVTRSVGGDVVGFKVDGADHHAGDDYVYDNAGRLTQAHVPGAVYDYGFEQNPSCAAPDSYKNTNRSSQTVVPTGGTAVTTGYCYDHADRLIYANDPVIGTVGYDSHGNATEIFGETHGYDAADRHMTTTKGSTLVSYVRDATDRIVERTVNGTVAARYGSTGSSDAPEYTLDDTGQVEEVTYSFPGGVLLTTRATGNVWSYPNIHGDMTAVADQTGVKQGPTRVYDPFGNPLPGTDIPDNSAGSFDYGWLGQHQRPLEHQASLQPVIEMGARQYSPLVGRFLEVDPVEGGSANDYDYAAADPCNSFDLDGERLCPWAVLQGGRFTSTKATFRLGFRGGTKATHYSYSIVAWSQFTRQKQWFGRGGLWFRNSWWSNWKSYKAARVWKPIYVVGYLRVTLWHQLGQCSGGTSFVL